jgi:hypothetical protein
MKNLAGTYNLEVVNSDIRQSGVRERAELDDVLLVDGAVLGHVHSQLRQQAASRTCSHIKSINQQDYSTNNSIA